MSATSSFQRRRWLPFYHSQPNSAPKPSTSVSGGFAPTSGQKMPAAPALSPKPVPAPTVPAAPPPPPPNAAAPSKTRPELRSGVGLQRSLVPTVFHAPGTVPYFPPQKPAEKVPVTEQVFQPWSFAVTNYGIHGKKVPKDNLVPASTPTAVSSPP